MESPGITIFHSDDMIDLRIVKFPRHCFHQIGEFVGVIFRLGKDATFLAILLIQLTGHVFRCFAQTCSNLEFGQAPHRGPSLATLRTGIFDFEFPPESFGFAHRTGMHRLPSRGKLISDFFQWNGEWHHGKKQEQMHVPKAMTNRSEPFVYLTYTSVVLLLE